MDDDDTDIAENHVRQATMVQIRRNLLIGGSFGAALLIVAALLAGVFIGKGMNAQPTAATVMSTPPGAKTPASTASAPSMTPTPTAAPNTYYLGQVAVNGGISVQLNSVQIVPSVPDTDGGSITPDAGAELVYFQGVFTNNTKQAVDLTCSADQIYANAYATNGDEMSDLGDEDKIAGNPVCNTDLVTGQSHAWNFVYTAPAGTTPGTFVFQDTTAHPLGESHDVTTINLRPKP